MFDKETIGDLIHHVEVSRHQMNLRVRNLRRTKKQKIKEHLSYVQAGIESTHPEEEICQLVNKKAEATTLIRCLRKIEKL